MKCLAFSILILLNTIICIGQKHVSAGKKSVDPDSVCFTVFTSSPAFPGGMPAFHHYIETHITMPEAVRLLGFIPKTIINIYLDKQGNVFEAKPQTHSKLRLEDTIITAIRRSPRWKPGEQGGVYVMARLTEPFLFKASISRVNMQSLHHAYNTYFFRINYKLYSVDEAEKILGASFPTSRIEDVELYNGSLTGRHDETSKKSCIVSIKP